MTNKHECIKKQHKFVIEKYITMTKYTSIKFPLISIQNNNTVIGSR